MEEIIKDLTRKSLGIEKIENFDSVIKVHFAGGLIASSEMDILISFCKEKRVDYYVSRDVDGLYCVIF